MKRFSKRKSKPSMEDLVDHQRLFQWPNSPRLAHRCQDANFPSIKMRIRVARPVSPEERECEMKLEVPLKSAFNTRPSKATVQSSIDRHRLCNGADDSFKVEGLSQVRREDMKTSIKWPIFGHTSANVLPLSSLCKPTVDRSLSIASCYSRTCSKPASSDDLRLDGQFCSPACLLECCKQVFQSYYHKDRITTENVS